MMSLPPLLYPLAFLGIFNLIGGFVLGDAVYKLIQQHDLRAFFLIIWGAVFGGIPILIQIFLTLQTPYPWLALMGPALFFGAAVFSLLLLPNLMQDLGAGTLTQLVTGVLFLFFGGIVGVTNFSKGQFSNALTAGGLLVLIGGATIASSVSGLVRGKDSR